MSNNLTMNYGRLSFYLKKNPKIKKLTKAEEKANLLKKILKKLKEKGAIVSNAKKYDVKHTHFIFYESGVTLQMLMMAIRQDDRKAIKRIINERINLRVRYKI